MPARTDKKKGEGRLADEAHLVISAKFDSEAHCAFFV